MDHRNDIEKITWKQRGICDQRNYTDKSTWKQRGFSTIKITSKKVRGNNVDFSTIEITLKKYAEMTWKFVEIWSSTWCVHWDPPPFPCRIWNISSNQRFIFNHHQTTETTEKATAVRQQVKISNQKIKLFSYWNRERSYRNALRIL